MNQFKLIEESDGTTAIQAQLGFSTERIDNIEEFILTNTQGIEPIQTLEKSWWKGNQKQGSVVDSDTSYEVSRIKPAPPHY